jgi:outer membrane murein-binding lipoprotein Lpp
MPVPPRKVPVTGSDTGSITLLLLVLFLGTMMLAGIVSEASRAQHASAHASDLAAKAARAGAQEIDPAGMRTGTYRLNPTAARQAAMNYLSAHQLRGTVQTNGGQISVTVVWQVQFRLLAPIRNGVTGTQTRTVAIATGP